MKEKQIVQHFVQCRECLLNPPSLLCSSNNNPFLNSRISAKHDKREGVDPILSSLHHLLFLLVYKQYNINIFPVYFTIKIAPFTISMVEIEKDSFLETLRKKLLWGEDKRN